MNKLVFVDLASIKSSDWSVCIHGQFIDGVFVVEKMVQLPLKFEKSEEGLVNGACPVCEG